MEPEAYLTIIVGLALLAFILYIFKYWRKKPDYSKVPEVFKETLPDEEGEEEEDFEEEDLEDDEAEEAEIEEETSESEGSNEDDDGSDEKTTGSTPTETQPRPALEASSPEDKWRHDLEKKVKSEEELPPESEDSKGSGDGKKD